jgi:adenine-specific DNA-methyltransferase
VDFDNTENLFIEGDNLDALKLLQETYLGKVKMIYIDPPYNTGKDFIYADNFAESTNEYLQESGQLDAEGNRLVANTDSNGRFHSDWISMMYSRLKLARNLLKDDGVIFISIDDGEVANLRRLADEIFGDDNFITQVEWQRAYAPVNMNRFFSPNHDHLLVYVKNIDKASTNKLPRTDKQLKDYKNPDNDPRGKWKVGNPSVGPAVEKNIYPITLPSGRTVYPPSGRSWLYSEKRYHELIEDDRIYFGEKGDSTWAPKLFLNEVSSGVVPMTIWEYKDVGHSQDATKEVKAIFDGKSFFSYPKPVKYLKRIIQIGSEKDSIILDFFAGSSTTAHAAIQSNALDGGHRKFIMVQLPESCDEKSEAYKAGYSNIAEISKERIRRAGKKIKEENPNASDLDIGFRVLKVDSSNMNEVHYTPDSVSKSDLFNQVEHIKNDRSGEDLLFQVMLDWGVDLSLPIRAESIAGKTVYFVNDDDLVACFEEDIDEALIKALADYEPLRVVFRDDGFESDSVKINAEQIFKQLSPNTDIKAL